MEMYGVAWLIDGLGTALGRGGHLIALLVAVGLCLVYLCGGELRENPAKLVMLGFFIGAVLDAALSVAWRSVGGVRI